MEAIDIKQMLLVKQNSIPSEQLPHLAAGDCMWLLVCWNSSETSLGSAVWLQDQSEVGILSYRLEIVAN